MSFAIPNPNLFVYESKTFNVMGRVQNRKLGRFAYYWKNVVYAQKYMWLLK